MVACRERSRNRGVSLVELLVVIVILGILLRMAWLPFQVMLENQRLRTVASDLAADLALARAEAIKRSSRVGIARTTADWAGGWVVFDDVDRDGTFDPETDGDGLCEAGEECVLLARPAVSDTVKVCSTGVGGGVVAGDVLTFGPEGAVRAFDAGAAAAVTGIVISSTVASPGITPRRIEFSPGGRVAVVTAGVAACP